MKKHKPIIENGHIYYYPYGDIVVIVNISDKRVAYQVDMDRIILFDENDNIINEYTLEIPELDNMNDYGIYIECDTKDKDQIYICYKFFPNFRGKFRCVGNELKFKKK